jgi:predicted amidophosphoribosyltransferase
VTLLVCPGCAELAGPQEAFCKVCGSPLTLAAASLRARAILAARRSARRTDVAASTTAAFVPHARGTA